MIDAEAVTLRGRLAQVKAAYFTAAAITEYALMREPAAGTWIVRGTVAASDPYLLAQPGLIFVAPHKRGAWRWTIETFLITGTAFEARLGARL